MLTSGTGTFLDSMIGILVALFHVNVTDYPTPAWTRQQLRDAFP